MDYDNNKLGFRICSDNVDLALECGLHKNRVNVIVFLCLNNISRIELGKQLDYTRGTVSKNLIGNDHMSKDFKMKFCECYGFDVEQLEFEPIVFYYICCKKKREELIASGQECGPYYNFEYLNRYHFIKYATAEMIQEVKSEMKADKASKLANISASSTDTTSSENSEVDSVETANILVSEYEIKKKEYTDFEIAQVCSRSNKKIIKKDAFVTFPLFAISVVIIMTAFYSILSHNNSDPLIALYSLCLIPVITILTFIIRRDKLKKSVSQFSSFQYEIDENHISKPMAIVGIVQFILMLFFIVVSIIINTCYKMNDDFIIVLYILIMVPSVLGTIFSISGSLTIFKRVLSFRVKFDDLTRAWGFYLNFAALVLIASLNFGFGRMIMFLIFQIIFILLSLANYIIGKIIMSKYKLYEYVFDKKIIVEQ